MKLIPLTSVNNSPSKIMNWVSVDKISLIRETPSGVHVYVLGKVDPITVKESVVDIFEMCEAKVYK